MDSLSGLSPSTQASQSATPLLGRAGGGVVATRDKTINEKRKIAVEILAPRGIRAYKVSIDKPRATSLAISYLKEGDTEFHEILNQTIKNMITSSKGEAVKDFSAITFFYNISKFIKEHNNNPKIDQEMMNSFWEQINQKIEQKDKKITDKDGATEVLKMFMKLSDINFETLEDINKNFGLRVPYFIQGRFLRG